MGTQTALQPPNGKYAEQILVVKRTHLFPHGTWHGLKHVNFDSYFSLIQKVGEFRPRKLMEDDPHFKQIIPYLVFEHQNMYFLMQRDHKASEARLQSKFSLGIGGHIRQTDLLKAGSIFDWSLREFHEEVNYSDSLSIEPLGIINDDSNAVGQVHIGFVFLLHGNSAHIGIKSELQSGRLVSLEECAQYAPHLETWSNFIFEYLTQ